MFKAKEISTGSFFGALLLAAIVLVSGCEKQVSPNKVERKITEGRWAISSFTFLDSLVTTDYSNKLFGFGEGGVVAVQNEPNNGGSWSVGLNKKPTILYLGSFINDPYTRLNDDWEVLTCSSDQITLQSENGAYTNKLTFFKKEE